MIMCRWIFLRVRNVLDHFVQKVKTHTSGSVTFPENCDLLRGAFAMKMYVKNSYSNTACPFLFKISETARYTEKSIAQAKFP
jgi:hypothetical protein